MDDFNAGGGGGGGGVPPGQQLPLTATGRRLFPKSAGGEHEPEHASDPRFDERAMTDGNAGILPRKVRGGRAVYSIRST